MVKFCLTSGKRPFREPTCKATNGDAEDRSTERAGEPSRTVESKLLHSPQVVLLSRRGSGIAGDRWEASDSRKRSANDEETASAKDAPAKLARWAMVSTSLRAVFTMVACARTTW
ncbi:MAG: hypothetical protein QM784_01385 [Polyangiaceae bacterium]